MPRKGPVRPRKVEEDPVYGSVLVHKLINRAMYDGKKDNALKQVYRALEKVKQETKGDPVEALVQGIENVKPLMEVRPRRVGGAAYQVPMPVRGPRRESLAIRWMIFAARARDNAQFKTFADKLAHEIIEASKNEGGAVRKKQEIERVAEANKAFAHFRW